MFITFKKLNRLLTKSILLEIRNCSSLVCNKMTSMIMAWTWFGRILFWQSHAIDSPNLLFHFFLLSICSFHCNLVWISVRFFYSCLNNRKNKLMTTYQLSDGNVFYLQRNFCFCLNSLSINLKKQAKRILQHWSYFFLTWCFFFFSSLSMCVRARFTLNTRKHVENTKGSLLRQFSNALVGLNVAKIFVDAFQFKAIKWLVWMRLVLLWFGCYCC